MKKMIIIAVIAALTTAGNAATKDFHISGGTSTLNDKSQPIIEIGYGVTSYINGLLAGVSFDFAGLKTEKETTYNFGGDLKLGITLKDTSIYGIGALLSQSYNNSSAYGYGFGAGAEYKITNNFATALEYKSYNMTPESGIEYDFSATTIKMKYLF
jgi:opacity protein-like surface antigen